MQYEPCTSVTTNVCSTHPSPLPHEHLDQVYEHLTPYVPNCVGLKKVYV